MRYKVFIPFRPAKEDSCLGGGLRRTNGRTNKIGLRRIRGIIMLHLLAKKLVKTNEPILSQLVTDKEG